jgi:C4-dicarboxylate transporter DctM subunit
MSGIVIFALLIALMLTGMPISISLGLTVLIFLFTMTDVPLEAVALKLFTGIEKFEIMAIPFFILAGNFLTHGGVAKRMIRFATAIVGHLHGGLALGGVVACALFAAVSGSSPATVVAIGSILLPAMVKQGYPKKFGVGVIATAGGLGILIPPSIVMVIYAVSTNSSIGRLFIAGIIPGILLAGLLMFVTWVVAKKRNYPRMKRASLKEVWSSFRDSVWGLFLIVVVIGGIYAGLFTPTEAAAMSAAYAFFVSVFVYKDLTLKQVPKVLLDSANLSAMILYIITNAVLFSFLLTSEQIPQSLAGWINDMGLSPWMFLVVVNILLLIAGNFMEPSSILLITGSHDGQHGDRDDHAAGRAESLCGFRHFEHGADGSDQGRGSLDPGDARVPAADHLRADHLAVAAEPADGRGDLRLALKKRPRRSAAASIRQVNGTESRESASHFLDQDHVHAARPVHAELHDLLDVGRARRPRDEVDRARQRAALAPQPLPDFLLVRDDVAPIEHRDHVVRREVQRGRRLGTRQHHQAAGLRYRREAGGDADRIFTHCRAMAHFDTGRPLQILQR